MFTFKGKTDKKRKELNKTVTEQLKIVYRTKLLPLEAKYKFHHFHGPPLDDLDFDAKPMIMLVGQYSTGKTSFIRYLLQRDYPGIRIGPEPTTDSFITIMNSKNEQVLPGNALVIDPEKPFKTLSRFGNNFLHRFNCAEMPSSVLEGLTIIDTPGILSGSNFDMDRGYDFNGVLKWFTDRADRIILLFDANKLDISDEFRGLIEHMRGHQEKVRIVLNKADMIDNQQLMRVYGALMWFIGKILHVPEVERVYIGTFWDRPLRFSLNKR
ncbi:unnamed protein product [Meganyctiphanes norvegica]|uniref:Dynamin-type G domain-containing protein n=1 Tax=Meganyctiphanes norvegica TaxID=48144 RepID=A0AAV2RIG0_MEGNR